MSLLTTSLLLPIGTLCLLLPPILELESNRSYHLHTSIWPPFEWALHYLLSSSSTTTPCRLTTLLDILISRPKRDWVLYYHEAFPGIFASIGLGLIGVVATGWAIERTKEVFLKRGFQGKDLLKNNPDPIPESLGLPTAAVYMAILFLFIPFRYFQSRTEGLEGVEKRGDDWVGRMDGRGGFPHHELASFLSALLSFSSAIVLGFLDDVFDIRWRYKLPIPIVSSIPLLMVYYASGGGTSVVVPGWPKVLRRWIGGSFVELGPLYYVYMSLLSTFCTNSINILAGINGVEVGQALIISISLCINSLLYLDPRAGKPGSYSSEELLRRHSFSLYMLLPLTGVCIALLGWNRYPAKVFVGDTFCYFAGMVFSTVGILGHFSKTVLLFFIPQIGNFLLSCPQLFGLVPCPRHRVPRYHPESNSLYPSIQYFSPSPSNSKIDLPNTSGKPLKPPTRTARLLLKLLASLRLVQLDYYDVAKTSLKSTTNLTILNAILVWRGVKHIPSRVGERPFSGPDVSEYSLWWHMMGLQVAGSAVAFAIRYWIARIVFP